MTRIIKATSNVILTTALLMFGLFSVVGTSLAATTGIANAATVCEQANQLVTANCNLYAGIGANYGPQTSPSDTQTSLSGSASTLEGDAGKSVTLGATWADTQNSYGVPSTCGNVDIPAGSLSNVVYGASDVIDCDYWILGESGLSVSGPFYGTCTVNDLVDWFNHPSNAAWSEPYPQSSSNYTYQCVQDPNSCGTPYLTVVSPTGGVPGQLCNATVMPSTPSTVTDLWCSGSGSSNVGGSWTPSSSISMGCPGGYESYANSNWCQSFVPQTEQGSSTGTLVLQTDGNLNLLDGSGGSVWSSLTMGSHCSSPTSGGIFCIPVSSTLGTQFSTSGSQNCNTEPVSAVTAPGECERLVWFYATDSNGTGPGTESATCAANAANYFQNNAANIGNSPTGCQVQEGPQITSTSNQSFDMPSQTLTSGEGFYAVVVVYEWSDAGSYNGTGGGYEFPIAHTSTGLIQISSPNAPTPATSDYFNCYNGQTWTTACSTAAGNYINVSSAINPEPAYYPSGNGYSASVYGNVGTSPPSDDQYPSSNTPWAYCASTCGISLATNGVSPVYTQSAGFPTLGVYAEITGSFTSNPCGVGIENPSGQVLAVTPASPWTVATLQIPDPSYNVPTGMPLYAFYVQTCGDNYPTGPYDSYSCGLGNCFPNGPEPIFDATWYDYTAGVGFEGEVSSTWSAPNPVNTLSASGQWNSLCEYGGITCPSPSYTDGLPVTNNTAGTYTLRDHYIWVGYGNGYAGYPGEPSSYVTLTFTQPPPSYVYNQTSTAVSISPNPSTVGQSGGYTITTTTTVYGAPVPGGSTSISWAGGSCSNQPVNAAGQTTCSEPSGTFPLGTTYVSASYGGYSSGYSIYEPSTGATNAQVNPPGTSTSVVATPNPANIGQSVTLQSTTIQSSGGQPVPANSGSVIFTWPGGGSCNAGQVNSSGQASCSTSSLPLGTDTVVATYDSSQFGGSSGSVIEQIQVASPLATCSVAAGQGPTVQTNATNCTLYTGNVPTINLSYSATVPSYGLLAVGTIVTPLSAVTPQSASLYPCSAGPGAQSCSILYPATSATQTATTATYAPYLLNENTDFHAMAAGSPITITWIVRPVAPAPTNYPT